jgi:hypothetical protein
MPKPLIVVSIVVLIAAVVVSVMYETIQNEYFAVASISLAQCFAAITMLYYGTLVKTKYFRIVFAALCGAIIGGLMKTMHLPLADIITITSDLTVIIVYSIHFYHKPTKQILDILKLCTIIVIFTPKALVPDDYYLGSILLAVTFGYVLFTQARMQPVMK